MNVDDAPSAAAGDGLAAFCFSRSAAEAAFGDAEALGEAVAFGDAVGLPDAFGVPDGEAEAVAGAIGEVLGTVDAFGGFVNWVSAGAEVVSADGCFPTPNIKYAEAAVAISTAIIPTPIKTNGSFELAGTVVTDSAVGVAWATG